MRLATDYIKSVLDESILVCNNIKLAIQKHLRLLNEADQKGYYFDEEKATYAIETIKLFRHTDGEVAGKQFQLLGWQAFALWYIFGWHVKKTGKRLVRKSYIEIPKKNGKTEFAAAIGLLMSFFDGEIGAQNYIAARNKHQAGLCYRAMAQMIKMAREESPEVRRNIPAPNQKRIYSVESNSFIATLSKDSEGAEGINTHCGIVDELHAHPDGSHVENMETSMVARSQPLLFIITTAGRSLGSYCFQLRKTCIEVLQGIKDDDRLFSLIYTLDDKEIEGDEWQNPELWPKANPSIGIQGGLSIEALKGSLQTALNEGVSSVNYWKTRHLNIWVSSISSWINDEEFKKCKMELKLEAYRGRLAFGGIDLSSDFDLSAFALLIPPEVEGEKFLFFVKNYLPADNIEVLEKKHRAPYRQWSKEGWITLTEGNTIDYNEIEKDVIRIAELVDLKRTGYDRKFAIRTVSNLEEEGVACFNVSQTTITMNAPIKEIEVLVKQGKIAYNSPLVRWMMSNVAIYTDTDGCKKVNRNKSGKVDGIVAMLMSMLQYLIWLGDNNTSDIYKDEGIFFI